MTCIYSHSVVPELKKLAEQYITSSKLYEEHYGLDCKGYNTLKNYSMGALLKSLKSKEHESQTDGNENEKVNDSHKKATVYGSDSSVFAAMKYEINRVKTFQNSWPSRFINPTDLAAIGFFFTGVRDRVQCAFCRGIVDDWNEGDVPLKEHLRHFPMCPFLLQRDVGNVPIEGTNGLERWQVNNSVRECLHSHGNIGCDSARTTRNFIPKYPNKNNIDVRLQTFRNWPLVICLPEQLAECGFFYTGASDVVTCFCCGGSLGNWELGDDPWIEHAKHFSTCAYVKFIKGSRFIESARTSASSSLLGYIQSSNVPNTAANNDSPTPEFQPMQIRDRWEAQSACHSTEKSSPSKEECKYLCKICMEERPRVAFLPCGHSFTCSNCAKMLTVCPMCRKNIDNFVRIYFD